MSSRYTKEQKDKAIKDCLEHDQDPFDYIDYADLRRGKQNWEYFLPKSCGGLA